MSILTSSVPQLVGAQPVRQGRRAVEAQKARRRLYPVTIVYTASASALLGLSMVSAHWVRGFAFYAFGFLLWTWVEYEVHRHVLHGRFPDGPGLWQHFLHKSFDHLHWEHHARPWDGNHVNGTLKDTGLFVALFLAASFLFPAFTVTMLVAGVIQAYVVEEWVHHSVHFCSFRGAYFRYIKRHHLYHHSPKGSLAGYGLTNGVWDIAYGTRFPESVRRALYHGKTGSSATAASRGELR
jgi:sterol desaturase/sphingolipid hydroxylase (fatty acid hydroxylase superfamily)